MAFVVVGIHRYGVHPLSQVESEDLKKFGDCDPANHRIRVLVETPQSQIAEILWHEVQHAVWAYCGLAIDADNPDEESSVLRTSPVFVGVLRANPWLVEVLLGEKTLTLTGLVAI